MSLRRIATDKIVVFDATGDYGVENRLFDPDVVTERHGRAACYLYEECLKHGLQLLTTDLYFSLPDRPKRAIFIRNSATVSKEKELLASGVHPAALFGFEHPLYACRFYWNLEHHTRPYDHVFMPSGARTKVSPVTKFHGWVSPQAFPRDTRVVPNFRGRKHLVMISGNARLHPLKRLYVHVMNRLDPLPTLADRELYLDRLEAIRYFSQFSNFDLYGRGWERPVRYTSGRYAPFIRRAYRGEVADKMPILKQYRFSICFENAIFGGWITEKIIDSLFAGCIPVYWGAPDVTDYIPAEVFIDFRNFKNYQELDAYLRNIDEKTYRGYIANINDFIASGYDRFSQEKYAEDMVRLLSSYFS